MAAVGVATVAATKAAIEKTGRKALLLASCSLSHRHFTTESDLPEPEDYALPYIFLASKQNLIVTGQTWVADQGMLNRSVLSG